jgi:hypothetical protein
MERLNNWMTYSFDDGPIFGPKLVKDSIFKLHFAKDIQVKDLHYYDALKYNAQMVAENFAGPFDVLLSGGIDSEIVVRINHLLGIKQNAYTFRLENNYNIRDVDSAQSICDNLGIKLNIIDWNLQHWIENEAHDVYKITYSPVVERMVRFAWFKYFDNTIVMGEGEPYWRRELGPDYSKKSEWHLHWVEDYFMSSIYAKLTGQTVIGEWYNYTPEVVKSFHKLPLIKQLLNDEIPGKVSCWSSRQEIHIPYFPDIKTKPKLVGYEGADGYPYSRPEFMTKFQEEIIGQTSNNGYKFNKDDIDNLLK